MFLDWWLWGRVVLSLFTNVLCCISSVSSTRTPRPLIPPFCSQPFPFLPCPLWPSLYIAKAPFLLPLLAPALWLVSGPHGIIVFSLHVLRTWVLLGGNRSHGLMVVGQEAVVTQLHWSQSLNPPWYPSLFVFITVFFPIFCNSNFQFFYV